MKTLFALALAAALAACATTTAPLGPPDFQAGWRAGCDSGFSAAGNPYYSFARDLDAYAQVGGYYRQGWDAGFENCRSRYQALR